MSEVMDWADRMDARIAELKAEVARLKKKTTSLTRKPRNVINCCKCCFCSRLYSEERKITKRGQK